MMKSKTGGVVSGMAYQDNKLYLANITKESKDDYLNSWLAFIDHKENPKDGTHKVYLVIYHGERRKKLLEESKILNSLFNSYGVFFGIKDNVFLFSSEKIEDEIKKK